MPILNPEPITISGPPPGVTDPTAPIEQRFDQLVRWVDALLVQLNERLLEEPQRSIYLPRDGRQNIVEYIGFEEIADPTAPADTHARLYVKDAGSSKTKLSVRFPTGAVIDIASEP